MQKNNYWTLDIKELESRTGLLETALFRRMKFLFVHTFIKILCLLAYNTGIFP